MIELRSWFDFVSHKAMVDGVCIVVIVLGIMFNFRCCRYLYGSNMVVCFFIVIDVSVVVCLVSGQCFYSYRMFVVWVSAGWLSVGPGLPRHSPGMPRHCWVWGVTVLGYQSGVRV